MIIHLSNGQYIIDDIFKSDQYDNIILGSQEGVIGSRLIITPVVYGKVRCGKVQRGVKHPVIEGYMKIGAYSNGSRPWKELSPFLLGPIEVIDPVVPNEYYPNGIYPGYVKLNDGKQKAIVKRFENYWQGSKIYNVDMQDDHISKSFYIRRGKMYELDKGKRRALPKAKGYPVAGMYNGDVMGYVESRKKIYCPIYAELARKTQAYKDLYKLIVEGQNVLIVGPDGQDIPINLETMKDAVNDPNYIFGHELVLCCLMIGARPWLDIDIPVSGPIPPL
jgi:hypothetical protein